MVAPDNADLEPAEPFGLLSRIGSGGQGAVYALPNVMVGKSWPAVYKRYNATALADLDQPALAEMVRFMAALTPFDQRKLGKRAAWPAELVEVGGRTVGFLMRQVPDEFTVPLRLPGGEIQKLAQVQLLLNDRQYLRARNLRIDDLFRLEFLRDTARTLDHLHGLDITVGDLSPNNLLFSRKPRPRCFLIDCDAMRLRGRSVLRQGETNDWQVPAGEELATRASDSYKFGLLCVRLFAGDQTTRDVRALDRMDRGLRDLAGTALAADPASRPSMVDWVAVLDRALGQFDAPRSAQRTPRRTGPRNAGAPTVVNGPRNAGAPTVVNGPRGARASVGSPAGPGTNAGPGSTGGTPSTLPRRGSVAALVGVTLDVLLLLTCTVPRLVEWAGTWSPSAPSNGSAGTSGHGSGSGTSGGGTGSGTSGDGTTDSGSGSGTSGDDTSEDDDADEQAAAIRDLLADSGRDRRRIAPAVEKVVGCTDLSGAARQFREAAAGRQAVLERARELRTDALPDGAELKDTLVEALSHSKAADDAFARWADAVAASGCGSAAMNGAHRKRGDAESRGATAAKQHFVTLWAAIAEPRGYRVPSYRDI